MANVNVNVKADLEITGVKPQPVKGGTIKFKIDPTVIAEFKKKVEAAFAAATKGVKFPGAKGAAPGVGKAVAAPKGRANLSRQLQSAADKFRDLNRAMKGAVTWVGKLHEAAQNASKALRGLSTKFEGIKDALKGVSAARLAAGPPRMPAGPPGIPAAPGGPGGRGGIGGVPGAPGGPADPSAIFLRILELEKLIALRTRELTVEFRRMGEVGAAGSQAASKEIGILQRELQELRALVGALDPASKKLLADQKALAAEERKAAKAADAAAKARRKQLDAAAKQAEKARAAEIKRREQVRKLRAEIKALEAQQRAAARAAQAAARGGRQRPDLAALGAIDMRGFSEVGAQLDAIGGSAQRAGGQMRGLAQLSEEVGRKAGAFRAVAIALNTLVNATKAAVAFVINFNDQLIEVNKILRLSDEGVQSLGKEILDLAARTGVAAEEVAGVVEELARAGLASRGFGDILQLTRTVIQGAQGTTLSLAEAAEILIQVIGQLESGAKGLNKELITTGRLFAILGRVEDITASKAIDVQDAFKRSAATILSTGASAEKLTAAISVLQEKTRRGGRVIGTSFKTIGARITATGAEASRALKGIGVDIAELGEAGEPGKIRDFFDIIGDLAERFSTLTEEEQRNLAVRIAGVRQVEILLQLLRSFDRVQSVAIEAQLAAGDAARKQAEEQRKLSTQIRKIRTELQKVVQTISEGVVGDIFKLLIVGTRKALRILNDFNDLLGGRFLQGLALLGLVRAFKALGPLIVGVGRAIRAVLQETAAGGKKFGQMRQAAQAVATGGVNIINNSLKQTLTLQDQVNAKFTQMQQLSAGAGPRRQPITVFPKELQEIAPARRGGRAAIQAGIVTPELKVVNDRFKLVKRSIAGVNRGLEAMSRHSLASTVGLTLVSSLFGTLADKARKAGSSFGFLAAKLTEGITQGAALGLLFGPKGALIGALIGGFKGAGESIVELTRDSKSLSTQLVDATKRINELTEATEDLDIKNRFVAEALLRNTQAFAELEIRLGGLADAASRLPKIMRDAQAAFDSFVKVDLAKLLEERDFTSDFEKNITIGAAIIERQFKIIQAAIGGVEKLDIQAIARLPQDAEELNQQLGIATRLRLRDITDSLSREASKLDGKNREVGEDLARSFDKLSTELGDTTKDVAIKILKDIIGFQGQLAQIKAEELEAASKAAEEAAKLRTGADLARGLRQLGITLSEITSTTASDLASLAAAQARLGASSENLIKINKRLAQEQLELARAQFQRAAGPDGVAEQARLLARTLPAGAERAAIEDAAKILERDLASLAAGVRDGSLSVSDALDRSIALERRLIEVFVKLGGTTKEGDRIIKQVFEVFRKTLIGGAKGLIQAQQKVAKAGLAETKFEISEGQTRIKNLQDQIAQIKMMNEIEAQRLAGLEQLESKLNSVRVVTELLVQGLDKEIAKLQEQRQETKKGGDAEKKLTEQIKKLASERTKATLRGQKKELQLIRQIVQLRIAEAKKQVDFQLALVKGTDRLTDSLGDEVKGLAKFTQALARNKEQFDITMKGIQEQLDAVEKSTLSSSQKNEMRIELLKKEALVTLEAANAEADLLKERRDALKELAQEGVKNQADIQNAQKAVIDATRSVAEAFKVYRDSIQQVIKATTEFGLQSRLAGIEAEVITGSVGGLKQEILATNQAFNEAINQARELGAGEKILADLRKESIKSQIDLFQKLLSDQTSLADSFFTSTAEQRQDLFQGIRSLQAVTGLLGGSFENFKRLGEDAINDLGKQILSLPQEARENISKAVDTLQKLGVGVEGFTAEELKTALQTVTLGVSKDLDVDPVFEVQQKIADLTEQQAALQMDAIVAANEAVKTAKAQLAEAKTARELAKIMLDRTREEGVALQSRITEMRGTLQTTIVDQKVLLANKLDGVTASIMTLGGKVDLLRGGIVRIAQRPPPPVTPVTAAAGVGQTTQQVAAAAMSAATEFSDTFFKAISEVVKQPAQTLTSQIRETQNAFGANRAALQGGVAGARLNSQALTGIASQTQERRSNLPDDTANKEVISAIDRLRVDLVNRADISNETLTSIDENTETDAAATGVGAAAALVTPQQIDLNINAQENIQVVGLDRAAQTIVEAVQAEIGNLVRKEDFERLMEEVLANSDVLTSRGFRVPGAGGAFTT